MGVREGVLGEVLRELGRVRWGRASESEGISDLKSLDRIMAKGF